MLTLPAICESNGIIFWPILIILGALLTLFWGLCIVYWSDKTGSDSLEVISQIAFGKIVSKMASCATLVWLVGYISSYIIVVKTMLPLIISRFSEETNTFIGKNEWVIQILIATLYWIFFLLPFSLPRTIGALRFSSLIGFICCIFLVVVIFWIFIFNKELVPLPMDNFRNANYSNVSLSSVYTAFPFIISSYMYQPMVPAIYKNLENRNLERMGKVLLRASYGAVFLYIIIAVFGYLTFVGNSEQLSILRDKQNILELNYHDNIYFNIAVISLVFTIMAAGPLSMIPWKDTWEVIFLNDQKMTDSQNLMTTLFLTGICYLFAIWVPKIGDVISFLGFTSNPFIGFILPIACYLKLCPESSYIMKFLSSCILILIIGLAFCGMSDFLKLNLI